MAEGFITRRGGSDSLKNLYEVQIQSGFACENGEQHLHLNNEDIDLQTFLKAKEFIINNSYDEEFGARPIKRYVSRNLETILAQEIINDNIKFNSTIEFDANDKLYISKIN